MAKGAAAKNYSSKNEKCPAKAIFEALADLSESTPLLLYSAYLENYFLYSDHTNMSCIAGASEGVKERMADKMYEASEPFVEPRFFSIRNPSDLERLAEAAGVQAVFFSAQEGKFEQTLLPFQDCRNLVSVNETLTSFLICSSPKNPQILCPCNLTELDGLFVTKRWNVLFQSYPRRLKEGSSLLDCLKHLSVLLGPKERTHFENFASERSELVVRLEKTPFVQASQLSCEDSAVEKALGLEEGLLVISYDGCDCAPWALTRAKKESLDADKFYYTSILYVEPDLPKRVLTWESGLA